MKNIQNHTGDLLLDLRDHTNCDLQLKPKQFPDYTVLFITEGSGLYHADFGTFPFNAPVLMFATPLQHIYLSSETPLQYTALRFHGDFYCIEYHKAQVACNGLLFNNIYIEPSVVLTNEDAAAFGRMFADMAAEFNAPDPDDMVLRSYLQLLLAKSSNIKRRTMKKESLLPEKDEQMEAFAKLIDAHYLELHKPADYAKLLAMSPNNLSKRSMRYFRKSPSALIQERLITEAKKRLHLTRQSIKEIAYSLNFEDEFYFSRFFKKLTTVSPQTFRDKTGISIVADLPPAK
ncbi:helix-turn-helix domain-containing protein [Taibaiella soli]|uniref:AraC family transcriptional regulator n=1 Tax=Taibaiella soli TaxID=1649169 RepID=A0A2W2BXW2_9BACT|nr:helix-turn-helix domain-containing protein [Taibaiella soli]PZF72693.1 AraC family transcriptional regulator [Taibaiella soli]